MVDDLTAVASTRIFAPAEVVWNVETAFHCLEHLAANGRGVSP